MTLFLEGKQKEAYTLLGGFLWLTSPLDTKIPHTLN
jgi:hypothetical protein